MISHVGLLIACALGLSGVWAQTKTYALPAAATDSFDQKVTVLRQHMGLKQGVEAEAGSAAVVAETLDGAKALYFVVTQGCVEDANQSATRVEYRARLLRDATYADVSVSLYAAAPDAARKYAREMLQKISALNYASVK